MDKGGNAPSRATAALVAMLLLVAGYLAYANSLSVPFLFDDWVTIQENPKIRQAWPVWEALSPSANSGVGGRPIAHLSLVLNHVMTGDSLRGYHGINLLIHVSAAMALFGIVRRILSVQASNISPTASAIGVALIWLLHPLQTESVTYISQRTELLMGLFYLSTFYCSVRAMHSSAKIWCILAVSTCALGMASKEGMITAPATVLLYDYLFVAGSWRRAWNERRHLYVGLAATWLVLALCLGGLHHRGVGFGLGMTWWKYALIEGEAILRYLRLSVWPVGLIFDYGVDLGPSGTGRIAAGIFILALIGLTIVGVHRKTAAGFLGACFFLTLAPTSSVVPIPLQPIAENRPYLALAAILTGLLFFVGTTGKKVQMTLLISIALAFGALTHSRNEDYRSEINIWTDTVLKNPGSSRAVVHLGIALQHAGRIQEALEKFEAAAHLNPAYPEAHINLASAYGALGQHARAIDESQLAIRLEPKSPEAHYNLGVGLTGVARLNEAVAELLIASQLRPGFAQAHLWLANVFLQLGRPAEAASHADAALQTKPDFVEARYFLGLAMFQLGRLPEAAGALELVVHAQPDKIEAHYGLGTVWLTLGHHPEAIREFEIVLRLKPDHASAHANLGVALWRVGRLADARAHFEAALRIDPNHVDARENLARLGALRP